MDYIEFKGTTKNDAITEACRHFSIPSDKLDFEVVDEGKAGFLGIGAKPAVIKARVKDEEKSGRRNDSQKPLVESPSIASVRAAAAKIVDVDVEAAAKKFLEDVFKAMEMEVNIDIKYNESLNVLDVELSGSDMGVLIGKRGQTLDSLQYLISLVVNKGTGEYIRVKVDTENYRERRRETLENLAKNIAYKAKRTRRSISLEPMNPYERRIIHSTLQNDRYVTTHSEGEEPFRCVVVVPKRDSGYSDRGGYGRGGYNRSGYNRGGYSRSGYNRDNNRDYGKDYSRDYMNDYNKYRSERNEEKEAKNNAQTESEA